jgi:nucleoside-diphosphate-sugar epimerase
MSLMSKAMRILITGADGFLGTNICNHLSKNNMIIAISRKFENITKNDNIFCFKYDMENYDNLANVFDAFKPETVIHCAWIGGNASKDINEIWQEKNIGYGNKLLSLCAKYQVKHFIGLGSSAEFGDYSEIFNEESKCSPLSMYGISKYSFKMFSENFCKNNQIKHSWIRPVYTYGPYDVETRIIPKAILSFLKNKDLRLNQCSPIIDYLYVDDFCWALEDVISYQLEGSYIISSNQKVQVKNVIQKVYEIIKPNCKLIFDESIVDKSPQMICGSSYKITNLTKWKPLISLDEGLEKTISYFKQRV